MEQQGATESVGGEVGAALADLAARLTTGCAAAPLWQLPDGELGQAIASSYQAEQRSAAVGVAALREAASRGIPAAQGAKDAARLVSGDRAGPAGPGGGPGRSGGGDR